MSKTLVPNLVYLPVLLDPKSQDVAHGVYPLVLGLGQLASGAIRVVKSHALS